MLRSMTGYGSARRTEGDYVMEAEVRSVNHRYLKISVRGPEILMRSQQIFEAAAKECLDRGSVDIILRISQAESNSRYTIHTPIVENYARMIRVLQDRLKIPGHVDLQLLLSLPGAVESATVIEDENLCQQLTEAARLAVQDALAMLSEMRSAEGRSQEKAFLDMLTQLDALADRVEARRPAMLQDYQSRLRTRIQELLSDSDIRVKDEDLIRELAVYAERSDVAEELHRLRSHITQFREACARSESTGRRIEFIAQEMHREANTMGAKANDADVATLVVEMKGIIDRIKEQVMNVE